MGNEHISVKEMWEAYLSSIGERIDNTNKSYTSWYFCDNEKSAASLAGLVMEGTKRATTSLYEWFGTSGEPFPTIGGYSVITDWNGIAKCIIRTKKLTILPFKDVDEELANIEGEGDKSLRYWQDAHIDFFSRELKQFGKEFSPEVPVVFEEFELVYK